MSEPVDFFQLYAERKMAVPVGWRWFRSELLGQYPTYLGGFLITGASAPLVTRGKTAGRVNWRKKDASTQFSFSISHDALSAFKREWEIETGSCSACFGEGRRIVGWSATEGRSYEGLQALLKHRSGPHPRYPDQRSCVDEHAR